VPRHDRRTDRCPAGATPPDRLHLLARHGVALDRATDRWTVLDATVQTILELVTADASAVVVVRDGVARFLTERGLSSRQARAWSCPAELVGAVDAVTGVAACTGDDPSYVDHGPGGDLPPVTVFCAAPVVVAGTVDVVLYALRRSDDRFGAQETAVLSLLAGQAAAALQRVHAVASLERRRQHAEQLRAITRTLTSTLDAGQVLTGFATALLDGTAAERVSVLLLDEAGNGRQSLCVGAGSDVVAPARSAAVRSAPVAGLLRAALDPGAALSPTEDGADWLLGSGSAPARHVSVHRLAVDQAVTGLVVLERLSGGPGLDADDLDLVEQASTVAAVALRHAELYQRLELDRAQLRALHDVTLTISAAQDIGTTLQQITEAAAQLTGAARCRLGLRAGPDHYELAAVTGDTDVTGSRYLLTETVGGWVIETGRPAWTPDLAAGLSEPPEALRAVRRREGSGLGVPLTGRGGRAVGFLSLHDPRPGHFRRDVVDLLERFAAEAVLALDGDRDARSRLALEELLRKQAHHDPLTGLANRTLLLTRLEEALAEPVDGTHVGVLYLDVDRFKSVNDSLGHGAGDELLAGIGHRLQGAVRPQDLVARLGGDEFVVLARDLSSATDAALLADRVVVALGRPLEVGGAPVFVSASIGVVTAQGARRDAAQLLRDADIAMYQAKQTGRGRSVVFHPALRTRASGRLPLETELHQALDAGALQVHYQPIVRLADGVLTGFEALVRWPHASRGFIPPDEFIPVAEETGLVCRVDDLVMRIATAQLRRWQDQHDRPDLGLNVNLSAVSLHEPGLVARVVAALEASRLRPGDLTVELTETAAMRDPLVSLEACQALRSLGLRLAIDDFGTGWSNLGQLRQFPVAVLKIDRSFTQLLTTDPQGEQVVRAVLALADAYGLQVTAEGVETAEQATALRRIGCGSAQGWQFGRPVAAAGIDALLATDGVLPQPRPPVAIGLRPLQR